MDYILFKGGRGGGEGGEEGEEGRGAIEHRGLEFLFSLFKLARVLCEN
jgi:hypothetical protein